MHLFRITLYNGTFYRYKLQICIIILTSIIVDSFMTALKKRGIFQRRERNSTSQGAPNFYR